jgi:hypothetical protein
MPCASEVLHSLFPMVREGEGWGGGEVWQVNSCAK